MAAFFLLAREEFENDCLYFVLVPMLGYSKDDNKAAWSKASVVRHPKQPVNWGETASGEGGSFVIRSHQVLEHFNTASSTSKSSRSKLLVRPLEKEASIEVLDQLGGRDLCAKFVDDYLTALATTITDTCTTAVASEKERQAEAAARAETERKRLASLVSNATAAKEIKSSAGKKGGDAKAACSTRRTAARASQNPPLPNPADEKQQKRKRKGKRKGTAEAESTGTAARQPATSIEKTSSLTQSINNSNNDPNASAHVLLKIQSSFDQSAKILQSLPQILNSALQDGIASALQAGQVREVAAKRAAPEPVDLDLVRTKPAKNSSSIVSTTRVDRKRKAESKAATTSSSSSSQSGDSTDSYSSSSSSSLELKPSKKKSKKSKKRKAAREVAAALQRRMILEDEERKRKEKKALRKFNKY
jgi:hypothetical protein